VSISNTRSLLALHFVMKLGKSLTSDSCQKFPLTNIWL